MNTSVQRACKWYFLAAVAAWILPMMCVVTVAPDEIGVRHSKFSGVADEDLPVAAMDLRGVWWSLHIDAGQVDASRVRIVPR